MEEIVHTKPRVNNKPLTNCTTIHFDVCFARMFFVDFFLPSNGIKNAKGGGKYAILNA